MKKEPVEEKGVPVGGKSSPSQRPSQRHPRDSSAVSADQIMMQFQFEEFKNNIQFEQALYIQERQAEQETLLINQIEKKEEQIIQTVHKTKAELMT